MSETEHIGVLDSSEPVTTEAIRELTCAVTPHFALQVRNRLARLIAPLAEDDPARIYGEREIERLETLADNSGQPGSPEHPGSGAF
ncbi:MAG: hypothetical protein M9938_06910 [Solirubrobacterales bacterium]|nr:hypothetical protein [Solirubrobacterales bacterium]